MGGLKALMFRDVHKLWHVWMYVRAVGVGCVVGCVYSVGVLRRPQFVAWAVTCAQGV